MHTRLKNPVATSVNLMELDDNLILNILEIVVSDDKPCRRLREICQVNRAACNDEDLYDAINKRFEWYGTYGTKEELNRNRDPSWLKRMNVQLQKQKLPTIDPQTPWSAKHWFQYSCYLLNRPEAANWLKRDWLKRQQIDNGYMSIHPAFYSLKRQYFKKYIVFQMEDMLTTKLPNLEDPNQQFSANVVMMLRYLMVLTVGSLGQLLRVLDEHQHVTTIFNNLVNHVWKVTRARLNNKTDDYNSAREWRRFHYYIQDILNKILLNTTLGNEIKYDHTYEDGDDLDAMYGAYIKLSLTT
jgi:hypothetical protein